MIFFCLGGGGEGGGQCQYRLISILGFLDKSTAFRLLALVISDP